MISDDDFYKSRELFSAISAELSKVLVGQEKLQSFMLISLLCGGHILLEGLPGLAKTLAVKTLAAVLGADFSRIQFTPDLLPADIIGSSIYLPDQQKFSIKVGAIVANLVLADEINRASAKTQSALLEVMQEKQVTIAGETIQMPQPYLIIATQNPIEHSGTYQLPEAQKDRFLLKVTLPYPSREEEELIIERMAKINIDSAAKQVCTSQEILQARNCLDHIYVSPETKNYILDLVIASRAKEHKQLSKEQQNDKIAEIAQQIEVGASPRASIALILTSKAKALLQGRNYVLPEDVQFVAKEVLAHRIILNFKAEAKGCKNETVIEQILNNVKSP